MRQSIIAPNARRIFTQHISGLPEDVFPLLCPVRETEWLPGWSCRMLHTTTGIAELGAVFETERPEGRSIWLVTEYDQPRRIAFAKFQSGDLLARIAIDVRLADGANSLVDIDYWFVALTERGSLAIGEWGDDKWQSMMVQWERSMNRWLRTQKAG